MVIAYSRPFWPLFLHVLGAMALFGAILAVLLVSAVGWRGDKPPVLRRVALTATLVGLPFYVVMRAGAQWIYADEGWSGSGDPTWLGIGFGAADMGLLLLFAVLACAFWWNRSGRILAGRILAGLAGSYLLLLAVAWLAMSGKWG